jgi:formylglycine-generating enzyme required for sulfatase activity
MQALHNVDPEGERSVPATWIEAVWFCNWLSTLEARRPCYRTNNPDATMPATDGAPDVSKWQCNFEADGYRLPTEAEWEYACRSLTTTDRFFGGSEGLLTAYAIVGFNSENHPWAAATRMPNGWGLFDTYGNLYEWCWDRAAPYPESATVDPIGPDTGTKRIFRGASFFRDTPLTSTSWIRFSGDPAMLSVIGFRVVCRSERQQTADSQ